MTKWWRLFLAAVLNVTVSGAAAAQTVIVRHAPPGESIEVVLNATKVASGTADAAGDATLAMPLSSIGKSQIDANIFVDVCDKLHRVIVVERGELPDPQQPGCARRDIAGLYWVRHVSTLVVDVSDATPTLLLIKGSYSLAGPRTWAPSPSGLVVFGGGGLLKFRDAVNVFCGTVTPCSGDAAGLAYTAGVTFWVTPFLGAEASYLRPAKATAQASADRFRFNSTLDVHLVTIVGKIGAPIGPVRIYGQAGTDYHRGTATTTETINDLTVTVNDVSQTFTGGTQTFKLKTDGWGWTFGGGGEVWLSPFVALYADAGFAAVKGKDVDGGEGRIDDRVRFVVFGARVRIGR